MPYKIYPYIPIGSKKPCYSVVNSETYKIHAKCSTLENAEKQKSLLERVSRLEENKLLREAGDNLRDGDGIVDTVKAIADRLIPKKREPGKLPPKSRKLIEQIRDEPITSMIVVRTPIESYINKTLQLVSGGKWDEAVKSSGYDKLFHLSLFINDKYVLHKIEVTTLAKENPIKKDSETRTVDLKGKSVTIGELVEKTRQAMGDQRFTNYDPADENCQDFIMAVLDANGLNTPELSSFIKQDAKKIFEGTPKWTAKFAKFVTDLGAIGNRLIQGEGTKREKYINDIINKMPKHEQKGGFLPMLLASLAPSIISGLAGNGMEKPKRGRKKHEQKEDVPKKRRGTGKWITALKQWNSEKNDGKYYIPKKGSKEYDEVRQLME